MFDFEGFLCSDLGDHHPGVGVCEVRGVRFIACESVRRWRVLVALASHPSGEYCGDAAQIDGAFLEVLARVESGSTVLDYQPGDTVWVNIPPIDDPLYPQAMVYWCSKFRCTLAQLLEAYATAGSRAFVRDVEHSVNAMKSHDRVFVGWVKTSFIPTMTPATMPMNSGLLPTRFTTVG